MKDTIKYVGLDVSKEKIAVAIAEEGREDSPPAPRKASILERKSTPLFNSNKVFENSQNKRISLSMID